MDSVTVKRCRDCGIEKPHTTKFFIKGRKGQPMSLCRQCEYIRYGEQRRQAKAAKPKPMPKPFVSRLPAEGEPKTCTKCGKTTPATLENFYWDKRRNQYGAQCKECISLRTREQILLNPTKQCEYARRSYYKHHEANLERSRLERKNHPERIAERKSRYYAKPEKQALARESRHRYYLANRERQLESRRRWGRENPDKERARLQRRRALKLAASGVYTSHDVQLKKEGQKGLCYWCQAPIVGNTYHVDHIIALSKGGSNGPENICISCPLCNLSKKDKMPWEFAGRLF